MIKFLFFPLLLFASQKALHITFHAGCAGEISAVCNHFAIELDTWLLPSLPNHFLTGLKDTTPYIFSKDKASQIYKLHKNTFDAYDMIITSDIAPLSRIFLQNHWEKPLLIWVCNRFDINVHRSGNKVFPDDPYHQLFKSTNNMPNVEVIGFTPYEQYYAEKHKNIFAISQTISPIGLNNSHKGIYKSVPARIDKQTTVFIREYYNENNVGLSKRLTALKVKNYSGPFDGALDIKDFKAMVHLPLVMSNFFLWENLSEGIVHFIPSKQFYASQYKKTFSFIDWTKSTNPRNNLPIHEIFDHCEWYREDLVPLFVFFDSYEEIPHLLETTDFQAKKALISTFHRDHKQRSLEKWKEVFSRLLPMN